jgi:hypothetical protein
MTHTAPQPGGGAGSTDARLPEEDTGTDAVRVSVERPGTAARAYHLPYQRVGDELRFADLVVSPADPLVLAG